VYFLEAWVGFVDWYSGGESGAAAGCAGAGGCVELSGRLDMTMMIMMMM